MKTRLQAARLARGWSQSRLMAAMEDAAVRLGIALPAPGSLKSQLSMFENGRRVPGPDYRVVFCDVYQCDPEDLGLEAVGAAPQLPLLPAPRMPGPAASPPVLNYLKSVFVQYMQAEPLVGARFLVATVESQLPLIEELCKDANGGIRSEVVRVGARYAEFLGWLHQDTGDSEAAMRWTVRALDYSAELDDPALTSYVYQRRSNIAAEAGQAGHAMGLANAALRTAERLPGPVRATALRASANAHAMLGHAVQSAYALDEARTFVVPAGRASDEDGNLAPFCSAAYIDMEAASCALQLGRPEQAVDLLETSLRHWPAEQQRDRGLCLARLATAHARVGNLEAVDVTATEAARIAQSTGSARILAELGRLQTLLAPWGKLVEIAALNRLLNAMRGS
jgi:transcriptional regulator with XRE-family HTH domain